MTRLCIEGKIAAEEGARHADDRHFYRNMIKSGGMGRV